MANALTRDLIAAHEVAHHAAFALMKRFQETLLLASLPRRAGDLPHHPEIHTLTETITKEILPHLEKEEHELFPFLISHVPKLEAVVQYLTTEHGDFRETLQEIRLLLKNLNTCSGKIDREKLILKLQQSGTYLFFLFRNHLRAEREGLFRVVEETLNMEEKSEVLHLL